MEPETDAPKRKAGMTYEDVLCHLGEFGSYQRKIYLLLCLPVITCALHKLSGVFLQAEPNHRCRLPAENANSNYWLTPEEFSNNIPWDARHKTWSSCLKLEPNKTKQNSWYPESAFQHVPCDDWVFDKSDVQSSVVTDWNLVCDKEWLRPTADACVMMGVLIGAIVFGSLSDKYGRRRVFLLSLILQVIAGFLIAGSPNYICFLIFRLIIGSTTSGVYLSSYVLAMEMVGPNKRLIAGVVSQYFFTLGYVLTAGFAYFIKDWRVLQACLTVPGIIFLSYWWFIPESARWCLSMGRLDAAKREIMKIADGNKVKVSEDLLDQMLPAGGGEKLSEKPAQGSLIDLMRYPNMRKRSLNIFFNWFVNNITYYGLSWSTSNLGGNNYLNFFISGAVEVPAYAFLLLTLNRWGRRTILVVCMVVGGLSLMVTPAIPKDLNWLRITLVMFGKLAITASYGTVYVFTAEQFPTVIRNASLGASSMCARLGGIIAPYMNLLAHVWAPLPQLLFGVCTVIAGLLALLLPETLNKTLPDTIEEGERFGKRKYENEEDGNLKSFPAKTKKNSDEK